MSGLENDVKTLLWPYMFDGWGLKLNSDDLRRIAAWATKCWMAYALNFSQIENPFTEAEYRAMAASPSALPRATIWLLNAHGPKAHVGMGVRSLLLTSGVPVLETEPNNSAFAYLAAGRVVLFMFLGPDNSPQQLADHIPLVSNPPVLTFSHVRRIWPNPRAQHFPLEAVKDWELEVLLNLPELFAELMALPAEGLTEPEAGEAHARYLEGEDPLDLRREFYQSG